MVLACDRAMAMADGRELFHYRVTSLTRNRTTL